jgi:FkbM family methyltransferase
VLLPPRRADGTLPRRLDAIELTTDVGPLLIPADDAVMRPAIAATGDWELDEAMLFRAHVRRGMTVVDVGAHVGYYTVLAARAVGWRGRVIAVEPHPLIAALLRANVARNRLARRVSVVEGAAWRAPTRLTLEPSREQNTADNRVVRTVASGDAIEVEGIALDALDLDVGVVKVDAQGTDHVALTGFEQTLRRCRPVVFVEFWPDGIRAFGDEPAGVIDLYRALGFRLTIPGVQAFVHGWSGAQFVEAAERMPGGFLTLVLRP